MLAEELWTCLETWFPDRDWRTNEDLQQLWHLLCTKHLINPCQGDSLTPSPPSRLIVVLALSVISSLDSPCVNGRKLSGEIWPLPPKAQLWVSESLSFQELSEKLSRNPVLGAQGHLAFTGAACGLAAHTMLWTSMAPGILGICPCLVHSGIRPASLSSEQEWLELDEQRNRFKLLGTLLWRSQWQSHMLLESGSCFLLTASGMCITCPEMPQTLNSQTLQSLMDRISP